MFKRIAALSALIFCTTIFSPSAQAVSIPERIVCLSPSATEDLFAIGAGAQVIAVDDLSTFPATAPVTKLSAFNPNVEAIAAFHPDLVILNSTATKADAVKSALETLGIAVYFETAPNNLTEAYSEIDGLGAKVGRSTEAKTLVVNMKKQIASIINKSRKKKAITFFHELDNTLYSATSSTFIGRVYKDFNLANIADKASKADDAGYPQLQSEYIIKANPSVIFLADAEYGESLATIKKRAGWSKIAAVTKKNIVSLPADIPSRWGPRLVDFYQFIATAIAPIK